MPTCPPDCPGRRSAWYGWSRNGFTCPTGAPFCSAWNAGEKRTLRVKPSVLVHEIDLAHRHAS